MCRFGNFVRQVQYWTTMVNGRLDHLDENDRTLTLLNIAPVRRNYRFRKQSDNFYVHCFGSALFRESKYTTSP